VVGRGGVDLTGTTKKVIKAVLALYVLLSIPPVLYVSHKVIVKIKKSFVDKGKLIDEPDPNSDFVLTDEKGADTANPFTSYTLIAHAGGALFDRNGAMLTYTNAKEAVDQNYNRGHRVFEIDFALTNDDRLIAVHDWEFGKNMTGGNWTGVPSLGEWKRAKIYGEYTTLDVDGVIGLLDKYPDIYIVTDTKALSADMITKEFAEIKRAAQEVNAALLDRIIPQIYYPRMLEIIYALYPFQNVIYTLYQSSQNDDEVLRFVQNHPSIKAVTMWPDRAAAGFVEALIQADKKVYIHTVNRFEEAYEARTRGVFGFYTDYLF
jgi:glycerophosphoryl diester phosphodiesterase